MITKLRYINLICYKAKKYLNHNLGEHFGTFRIPESLQGFYEKKKEEIELKKKKMEENKKKKIDKVKLSKERKNKFKSSKGQHNIF
ncbi:conserved Plasmodium protein, unknown function [Plasmodium reichenowi]|uniref:Uncharacterized protein n=1 Tax=Plasmodium reichenowi TaxID=5854 RepID=A0A060RSG8_PLARE|nr:hypothetical protein PRSY57_0910700 [Plasmodium reichenowi]KYN98416.1 hypothetical protein PRSY57_0910700 [Plasmodium reichenowi]CDO64187.1 conserved Plasmodium protein, unknown function [Plasmodium reichenowi]SOV78854.1 conserved Plasmodium protein, unknown function [Plasmodium reichenowi]